MISMLSVMSGAHFVIWLGNIFKISPRLTFLVQFLSVLPAFPIYDAVVLVWLCFGHRFSFKSSNDLPRLSAFPVLLHINNYLTYVFTNFL